VYLTYIRRELRRRFKQSLVIALGLAVGIALVVTVSSAAAGVKSAQGQVLHSLYGVGTDMTVTRSLGPGSVGPQRFGGFGSGPSQGGTRAISRDVLRPQIGSGTLPSSDVTKVRELSGVAAASGGLVLTDTSFSGTIPSAGGGGGFPGGGSSGSGGSPSFSIKTFTVDGIETGANAVGPLTASQVTSGSFFSASDSSARVAIVSTTYARQHSLHVGSKIDIAGKSLKVIGLASVSNGSADVFVPLRTAQNLAGTGGKVTTVLVSVGSASRVSTVASEVKAALPSATVSTSASLAKQVSGALSSASSLGRWLSIAALAVAFLVAGLLMMAAVSRRVREFGTLKAIGWRTRRVVAQVVGEGMALGLLGGLAGVALGVAAAAAISAVAPALSATVGSTFATGGGGFGPFAGGGATAGRRPGGSGAQSVLVHLTAPLQAHTILIALLLAVAGGLVAGGFGAWRAARLRPADALRSVG
jgi:ABC-type lipoprotein release transport system permease subunit